MVNVGNLVEILLKKNIPHINLILVQYLVNNIYKDKLINKQAP
jgi:hypothetical protein